VNGRTGNPVEDPPRLEVGLLLCDQLDPEVAEVAGDYTHLYRSAYGPAGIDLRIYDVTAGEFPDATDECPAWMTSGSRRSADEEVDWIARTGAFIADLARERRPHVGICFGHQLTALALGGRVERAGVGWGVGVRRFDVVGDAPWIEPRTTSFDILMSHQDQVVELPDGAELLATAEYCPVGGYRVGDHVFCVQGHPEFVPALSATLIERRRSLVGEDVADRGLASLDGPIDHAVVVDWIARFYRLPRPG
jgi:GMP synthase-like glutamine amidotransferase